MRIWPGQSDPLGVTWDGDKTSFALFSEHGTRVVLCVRSITLMMSMPSIKSCSKDRPIKCGRPIFAKYARDTIMYGYRVHGSYEPEAEHRFNPHEPLSDPYAKAVSGVIG
jgi:isoamylase